VCVCGFYLMFCLNYRWGFLKFDLMLGHKLRDVTSNGGGLFFSFSVQETLNNHQKTDEIS
jgi:hypothetical protein